MDLKTGLPVKCEFGEEKVEFVLPAKEQAIATKTEIKQNRRFRDDITFDLLTITATSNGCEFADKEDDGKIVATIKIFKFANAGILTEADYENLKKAKIGEIKDNGFIFGNNTRWNSEQRWFYLEKKFLNKLVTKTCVAIVEEFVILLSVCAGLPVEKIVNTLKITTKSGDFACKPFKEASGIEAVLKEWGF